MKHAEKDKTTAITKEPLKAIYLVKFGVTSLFKMTLLNSKKFGGEHKF